MTSTRSGSPSRRAVLALLAAIALVAAVPVRSQEMSTLHILLVADTSSTSDWQIGASCTEDAKTISGFFTEATNVPKNCKICLTYMLGDPPPNITPAALKYSPQAVLDYYKNLGRSGAVGPNDVVLCFISAHGRYEPEKGHCIFRLADRDHPVYRSELRKAMLGCNVRLRMLITDCCSNVVWQGGIMSKAPGQYRSSLVESLFFKPSGWVDINACSQGEMSAGTLLHGGFFTSVFFDKLSVDASTLETALEKKKLPVNKDGIITWREFFPLLMGPTAVKWRQAKRDRQLDQIDQESQNPQAYCIPTSTLDPPAAFNAGLAVDAVKKGDKDVLVVAKVDAQSPAEAAGLQAGDLIQSVDGKDVTTACELDCALSFSPDPAKVNVAYERGAQKGATSIIKNKVNQP